MDNSLNIIYLSTVLPRKCGLATFNRDLVNSIKLNDKSTQYAFVAMDESGGVRSYKDNVWFKIQHRNIDDYRKAADFINNSGADLLVIQHEFGIYGGFDGVLLFCLMENLKIPIVTVFHTIPVVKNAKRRKTRMEILKKIVALSAKIITTSSLAKEILVDEFSFPDEKIEVILHGAPHILELHRQEKEKLKQKLEIEAEYVFVTFGLLTPNKGLEYAIAAMEGVVKKYPDCKYLIIGEEHPLAKYDKNGFETYLEFLRAEIDLRGLKENVIILNNFLEDEELAKYMQISDVMITPYLVSTQVSSGVLSWGMTSGLALLTTPFLYARTIVDERKGAFIDYEDSQSIEKQLLRFLEHPRELENIKKNVRTFGKKMEWDNIAKEYLEVFRGLVQ